MFLSENRKQAKLLRTLRLYRYNPSNNWAFYTPVEREHRTLHSLDLFPRASPWVPLYKRTEHTNPNPNLTYSRCSRGRGK